MDGASVGTAIAITIGVIALAIVGCCGICCCCFAIPLFKIIGSMCWPGSQIGPTGTQLSTARTRQQGREYELVSSNGGLESGYQGNVHHVEPSAPPSEDVIMAEAYLVPPLAEVHTINADQVIGGDDSLRLQELQVETTEHKDGGFRDVWAAVLFLLNVAVIVYFAVQSVYLLKFDSSTETSSSAEHASRQDWKILEVIGVFALVLTLTAGTVGSWVLSFLMGQAENLIEMVMWGNIGIQGLCAILCLLSLQLIGALIFAVLAGLNYWYLLSVRPQIPFASTVLATACTAVKANYTGLITTAFSALFVQLVWIFLWTVALMGVIYTTQATEGDATSPEKHSTMRALGNRVDDDHFNHDNNYNNHNDDDGSEGNNNSLQGFYYFLLTVSLYWGIQVIKSVVQVTVAGTLACWWFQPQRPSPVRGSLFRALTTSFGSICFGSLIVAIIQAIREVLNEFRRRAQGSRNDRDRSPLVACLVGALLMVLDWLLDLLEQAVKYFNKYAYCYVAAYGLGFVQSGRLVTSLFTNRGWTAIINDNLISRALTCGVLALTVGNMICGVLLSFVFDLFVANSTHDMGVLALIGGLVGAVAGLIVGLVLSNALDSAVAMVFVCFAEDPLALQKNHPETYEVLRSRWESIHPSTLTWCSACLTSPGPSPVRTASATTSATSSRTTVPVQAHTHTHVSPYSVAPASGGVGGTGGGNVGVVYPIPNQVYTPPTQTAQLYAPLQPAQPSGLYNPYSSSPYSSGAGYGGYGGYSGAAYGSGGYGAASAMGLQHGSPSANAYSPGYYGAPKAQHTAPAAQYQPAANPLHAQHDHKQQGQGLHGRITVAQPAPDRGNPPPSAPPGYY